MNFFSRLWRRIKGMFFTESTTDIGKVFGIDLIMSSEMNAALDGTISPPAPRRG